MDNLKLEQIIKESGEIRAKYKALEVEIDLLREQNNALIAQNLKLKKVLEDNNII